MHIHTYYYFFIVAKNIIVDCMCNTASIYMTAYTGMQLRASHQLISPTEREFIPAEISLDPKLAKLISEPVQFLAIVVFLSKDILKSVFLISMFLLKIRTGVEDKGLRHKVIEIQPLLNHTALFASTFTRKNANQNLRENGLPQVVYWDFSIVSTTWQKQQTHTQTAYLFTVTRIMLCTCIVYITVQCRQLMQKQQVQNA